MTIALDDKDVRELRDLWLSRLMFNMFVGLPLERRSFEEFCDAVQGRRDSEPST